jgi:hypothetical protein
MKTYGELKYRFYRDDNDNNNNSNNNNNNSNIKAVTEFLSTYLILSAALWPWDSLNF